MLVVDSSPALLAPPGLQIDVPDTIRDTVNVNQRIRVADRVITVDSIAQDDAAFVEMVIAGTLAPDDVP